MENHFSKLMLKNSDEKLKDIIANRKNYDLRAYKAAVEELQKRDKAYQKFIENEEAIQIENERNIELAKEKRKVKHEFVSPYVDKNFSEKVLYGYVKYILLGFIVPYIIATFFTHTPLDEERYFKGRGFFKMFIAFFYLTNTVLFIILLVGTFVSLILIIRGRTKSVSKRIVVYVDFNTNAQILRINVRNINTNFITEWKIPYARLQLKENKELSDGLRLESYTGIEIYNDTIYLGELLEKHFTWNADDFADIKERLMSITHNVEGIS